MRSNDYSDTPRSRNCEEIPKGPRDNAAGCSSLSLSLHHSSLYSSIFLSLSSLSLSLSRNYDVHNFRGETLFARLIGQN